MEAREALKKDAKRFVITMGKNGAMIFDGDTFIDIEPYRVKAVDTNGAGDMFAGSFLYGITNETRLCGSGVSRRSGLNGSRAVWTKIKLSSNAKFIEVKMNEIVLASRNPNKIQELKELLFYTRC